MMRSGREARRASGEAGERRGVLRSLSDEARAALRSLRGAIASVVPEAEEAIAWSMPAFRLGGKAFVGYAAFKDHYSFFPMSTAAIDAHREALGEHLTGKGRSASPIASACPPGS